MARVTNDLSALGARMHCLPKTEQKGVGQVNGKSTSCQDMISEFVTASKLSSCFVCAFNYCSSAEIPASSGFDRTYQMSGVHDRKERSTPKMPLLPESKACTRGQGRTGGEALDAYPRSLSSSSQHAKQRTAGASGALRASRVHAPLGNHKPRPKHQKTTY